MSSGLIHENQWDMGFHVVFIVVFLIATKHICLGDANTTNCSEHERLALIKFKHSIKYDFGMLSSWVGYECCQWKGVRCDDATRSIVGLDLMGHNTWNLYYIPQPNPTGDEDSSFDEDKFRGYEDDYPSGEDCYLVADEMNPSLAELRHLKYLDLSGNDFRGSQMPEFIGSLKNLFYLNLSNAGFRGIIPPHMGNLSKLEILDLSASIQDLVVDDTPWVFGLSLLKHLKLNGMDLTRAQNFDMVFYMIPSLQELSLSHCSLTNALFGPHLNLSKTLSNIRYLDLSKNFFKDPPPHFLKNMTSLEFLDLSSSYSNLSWNLVNFLNVIPSLSELHLSRCGLHNDHLSPTHLNVSTHSNIQHLDLSWNSIKGRFPTLLTNMSSIRVLNLQHNILSSTLPVLPNLLKLDISSNNFTDIEHVGLWRQCHMKELSVSMNSIKTEVVGLSTNISECSQYGLEVLYLDHNQICGSIPKSLIRLTNLRVLDLSWNLLTNLIPASLGRLRILQVLDLSSNRLYGMIPVSIGQLGKISFLNVASNNLEGIILEAHLANLPMLKYLDISNNSKLEVNVSRNWTPPFQLRSVQLSSCTITGGFPQWLRTQKNIKKLVLSNTGLRGPLPTWLAKMHIIPHLDLSHNNLSGPLINLPLKHPPFNVFGDEYRGSLYLQGNLFNGSIPRSLCRRTALEILDLSRNRLSGDIPTCLKNLQNLSAMVLSHNGLSGFIPSFIGHYSLLSWLLLNDNNFTGSLPYLGNLDHLWILDLGNNELYGRIPESEFPELMILELSNNKFNGRIPTSLCKYYCLQILDVSENNLEGRIPRCLGELSGMIERDNCRHSIYSSKEKMIQALYGDSYKFKKPSVYLFTCIDLSSNELVGEIPKELTLLSQLTVLNLSHNHLSESISDLFGNMKELESIDLSNNNLTGMVPQSMTELLFLGLLNLSCNSLSGPLPEMKGEFGTFDSSCYSHNKDLCGPPLAKICTNHDLAITTSKNKFDAIDDPNKLWFYLDILCGFATGFSGVIGLLLFNKKWRIEIYRYAEITIDYVYVVVAIRVAKMKRLRDDA